MGNLGGMMKQAMEMKSKMEEMKNKLGDERVEASSGGGMVNVVMNGRFELVSLTIDPEIAGQEQLEELEVMVKAAVNEGVRKVQELVQSRMEEVTGGLNIPGLTG
jgi:hypothetical protein